MVGLPPRTCSGLDRASMGCRPGSFGGGDRLERSRPCNGDRYARPALPSAHAASDRIPRPPGSDMASLGSRGAPGRIPGDRWAQPLPRDSFRARGRRALRAVAGRQRRMARSADAPPAFREHLSVTRGFVRHRNWGQTPIPPIPASLIESGCVIRQGRLHDAVRMRRGICGAHIDD